MSGHLRLIYTFKFYLCNFCLIILKFLFEKNKKRYNGFLLLFPLGAFGEAR